MELDYKAIGKRIKIARINADMTQEMLSEAVELSPTHLSNIETGTTHVSLSAIVSLANALSVTVDDLLCDSVIKARPQIEGDIAAVLADCDDYEIRMIREKRRFAGMRICGNKTDHCRLPMGPHNSNRKEKTDRLQ